MNSERCIRGRVDEVPLGDVPGRHAHERHGRVPRDEIAGPSAEGACVGELAIGREREGRGEVDRRRPPEEAADRPCALGLKVPGAGWPAANLRSDHLHVVPGVHAQGLAVDRR